MRAWAVVLLVGLNAYGYQTGSAKWTTLPLTYYVDAASAVELGSSLAQSTVAASYASWAAPSCSAFRVSFAGTVTGAHQDDSDGKNIILWRYDAWPPELGGSSVIGLTLSIFSGGKMLDSDIQLNGVDHSWTTNPMQFGEVDAQSILTHEIGHQLGLQHSSDSSSTMYFTYPGGTSQRSLALDDISGVCALYPIGGGGCTSDAQCAAGEKCISGTCTTPPTVAGSFGDPCNDSSACMSMLCVGDPNAPTGICTTACTGAQDCPQQFDCVGLSGGGGACVAQTNSGGMGGLGDTCQSGLDCADGLCVGNPGASSGVCSQSCTGNSTCPAGFECASLSSGGGACVLGDRPDLAGAPPPDLSPQGVPDDAGVEMSPQRAEGCAVGGGAPGALALAPWWLLLLLVAFRVQAAQRPPPLIFPKELSRPAVVTAQRRSSMSIIGSAADHFRSGDWPMWPILGIFTVTIGIIIERFIYLRRTTVDKRQLMALLKSQLMAGNVQGAIKLCSGNSTPLTRIVRAGLTRWSRPDEEVQAAMDEVALEELPLLERRTGFLAMLSNLATLMGLLGTIIGLIDAFAGTAGVDASMKSVLLAKGISEAMNCTAFGLITGISALGAYSLLNDWTQRVIDDINEVSVKIVNLVVGHRTAMKRPESLESL